MDDNDRLDRDRFVERPIENDLERDHLFRGTVWSLVALIAVLLGVAGYWAVNGGNPDENLAERPPAMTQPYTPPAPDTAVPPAAPMENQPSGESDTGSPPVEPAEPGNTRL